MRRAVFLDRDGVVIKAIQKSGKPFPPTNWSELELTPHVVEACQGLKDAGFLLIIVTNQPDVGRGKQKREVVEAIHQYLQSVLPIDEIYVCYHGMDTECECRKPKPGLLLSAAQKWGIQLSESFIIGDRWKDVEAGEQAGCSTVFIDYGYSEKSPSGPTACVKSFLEASEWIIRHWQPSS